MQLSDFDYFLPQDLIAQRPCEPRDHSRLLVLDRQTGRIEHKSFYNLKQYLLPGDTLVFNDTRVIPARLIGSRLDSGGKVEVFLLNRHSGNEWETLVKPGKKARPGTVVQFSEELSCEILAATDYGGRIVRFVFEGIFEEILDRLGETPLPPYIKEKLSDKERYQTVYARERGSAAAPTAGLHFTRELMQELATQGINLAFITLHVGLGTFRPVKVADIEQHVMHKEYYSVSAQTAALINETRQKGRKVIAVGTTAVRTLETAGSSGTLESKSGWTDIFIYPGYPFKIVDRMITNFHLPQSTLLMLVSAFAGRDAVLAAYEEAVRQKYRFFSFGDAMLIL
ncbi:s-adenosylmethionine:trna ribosyltransferase-isomerase quea [Lucifera butyrica]|uniref:S-adenosylmethionine:tRNA ribosyltransferase-isomerase n=1 Tax=Lucifera butyrica TaxID=1351585 RepID=A0A498R0L5_9FIRM|nr:tRNA preQ1(34) S-adenosylmethionine ribosyltransferase-isomerase QueA [Lucifera butyrica]VBB06056.1 s-adenosylmethionine:trna ribosyltransferase-isomerase quea [Lucifera butyrica]